MEVMWLLIPLSILLVLVIIGVFGWALHRGQFDDLEREGQRILEADRPPFDGDQVPVAAQHEQSQTKSS
ncbi:MAG: cbb3-type cytochrome oxidase assembly protein CcoS [Rubrivivax sp.]|nr:cbb3-type cytochrome oxidase assembly protein CcoS [Rubrivivax sp.]